jgi:hypothetical protein
VFEMEGPDRMAGIHVAGRRHAVFEATVDRSPATMALPAALPLLGAGSWVEGISNRRHWRPFVRRYPRVDPPGRLVKAIGSQARCSLCPFCMVTLWLGGRGGLTSKRIGQNRR